MAGIDALTAEFSQFLTDVQAAVTSYQGQTNPDLVQLATDLTALLARGEKILGVVTTINSGLNQL